MKNNWSDDQLEEQVAEPEPSAAAIFRFSFYITLGLAVRLVYDFFSPFYWGESALVILFFTSPVILVIYRLYGVVDVSSPKSAFSLLLRRKEVRRGVELSPYASSFFQVCSLSFIAFILIGSLFALNQLLDNSLPESKTFTVVDTAHEEKKGADSYYVRIPRPDFMNLPFYFQTTEKIEVAHNDFERVVPWHTRIVLLVHRGAIGMPWYERNYVLEGLAAQGGGVKKPMEVDEEEAPEDVLAIEDACLWKNSFDMNREIETIEPDGFIRDYWFLSNAPRSVEPTVRGERHGIGHYTFANGQVYSDIPWKHGNKHGVFTLFREDGTRDQVLSYKNGQPFGINQWYSDDGQSIKDEWVYLSNGQALPVSVCIPYLDGLSR